MRIALLALAACHAAAPRARVPPPPTTAETSHFARTGHYDEAIALCHAYADAYPNVSCDELGRTGEGRPIVAVHVGRAGAPKPMIYVQAGIHAGEIEGKDAGFMLLRDLLDGKIAPGALDRVDVLFVPCINPDGHERFGKNNRPNQRGPEEMGFRTNGARQNLNRDFVKADTPEIQAVLGVFRTYDPMILVDIHTTDGAKFEHDVSITVGPRAPRADHLDQTSVALGSALAADMTARGHLPVTFYPSFITEDDPLSGFADGEAPPRFSQIYAGVRSRIGILVENHSWKTYEARVHGSYDFLRVLLERAAREAPAWQQAEKAADAFPLAGTDLPLVWDNGPHVTSLAFRGYAFEKKESEISGGTAITYDETKPQIWNVPFHDELVPKVTVRVPRAGYFVDGGYAPIVARALDLHGIRYTKLAGTPRVNIETFRATKVMTQPLFEGHARMQLEGAWTGETRTLDLGAIFVPIAQPTARLVVHLMDPAGPDSLAQWGVLATAFERKEYIESYVVEASARELLARDPAVRARFEAALAADPTLAKSAQARLEWFYKQMPSWDERLNLLPIYRADVAP